MLKNWHETLLLWHPYDQRVMIYFEIGWDIVWYLYIHFGSQFPLLFDHIQLTWVLGDTEFQRTPGYSWCCKTSTWIQTLGSTQVHLSLKDSSKETTLVNFVLLDLVCISINAFLSDSRLSPLGEYMKAELFTQSQYNI